MAKVTFDFETTSKVDLRKVGTWAYSLHPSTEVLCVGWGFEGLATGQWRMGEPVPSELFDYIRQADICEAHNSFFEFAIWLNVCVRKYGWPPVPVEKWRCSAAKAAACSISRKLGEAGRMLECSIVKEEEEGRRAMQTLSKGKKLQDEETWQKMLGYNLNDVLSEEELSASLPDLSKKELEVWRASERMNLRGIPIDRKGAEAAIKIVTDHSAKLIDEFAKITGIASPTQRAKFIVWLNDNGIQVSDSTKDTVEWLLKDQSLRPDVRRAIEILKSIGKSSTSKYAKILGAIDSEDRIRGCFLYHGAGTGRWAGKLIQPHNFAKSVGKWDMDQAWDIIHQGDMDVFDMFDADPMEFMSSALRGVICAPEGKEFLVADYASIEARVTAWLADVKPLLKLFGENGDVYIAMAQNIYNKPLNKKDNPKERQLGKEAILGLGFGMGYIKFLIRCRSYGITFTREQICSVVNQEERIRLANEIRGDWDKVEDTFLRATGESADMKRDMLDLVFTKFIVDKYRTMYPGIPYLWSEYERCAKAAVRNPGQVFKTHMTMWKSDGRFLMCRLPSGRIMRYFKPRIGESGALHYIAAKGDTGVFMVQTTYGGKLCENVVQAVARDILADAMLRLEATPPYDYVVMTVHDELVAEILKGVGDVHEFEKLVSVVPTWAIGLPVGAEAWRGRRYKK